MEYLVLFLNYDGTELYRTLVKEGETAVYAGPTPHKQDEKFVGWNKSLKDVSDNLIVTAVFEKGRQGNLKLGVISFVENEKEMHIVDQAVVTNKDLLVDKKKETEQER